MVYEVSALFYFLIVLFNRHHVFKYDYNRIVIKVPVVESY